MSDYDKEQWQAEQDAREQAQSAFRDKMAKSRERSANNAKRKIARLHAKLSELGHISDFEDEFGESVLERLEKYGSAFHDPEKGRAGDALSLAQRQVVNRMNRKVKELKAKAAMPKSDNDFEGDYTRTARSWSDKVKPKSGFKSKKKPHFTPNIRHIEDDLPETDSADDGTRLTPVSQLRDETERSDPKIMPFIPRYNPDVTQTPSESVEKIASVTKESTPKRPFLRLVSSD